MTRKIVFTVTVKKTLVISECPSSRPMPAAPVVIDTTGEEASGPGLAKAQPSNVIPFRKAVG